MIKEMDRQFLKDTVEELDWVYYPGEWIDSFIDIYTDIIEQYLTNLEVLWEAKEYITYKIYFNYSDTRIDLSIDKFLDLFPEHKDIEEELRIILN